VVQSVSGFGITSSISRLSLDFQIRQLHHHIGLHCRETLILGVIPPRVRRGIGTLMPRAITAVTIGTSVVRGL
jgi:hypothetical protein